MNTAFLRFYEELNEFLPPAKRKVRFEAAFRDNASVKSLVEGEGVPHTEIDLVLLNGVSVPFEQKVQDGDDISVYPVFESFDISGLQVVHLQPLRITRFVADVHLGKLARYLRMLGFDTAYDNFSNDDELVRCSREETRTILTRDRRLLMRREVSRGYWIRNTVAAAQAGEVVARLHLDRGIRPFSRCTRCNGLLEASEEAAVQKRYPGHAFLAETRFYRCTECGHYYWNGSHSARFLEMIGRLSMLPPGVSPEEIHID